MSTNGQNGGGPFQNATRGAHYLVFAARVLASPLEVCLRRGFGPKYFGLQAVGTLLLFPLWTIFWPREDPAALYGFWAITMFFFVKAKAESNRMVAKGDIVHTRYNGTSCLQKFFKRFSESKVKGTWRHRRGTPNQTLGPSGRNSYGNPRFWWPSRTAC